MSDLEIERELTRQEVADYLREFADKLAEDRRGDRSSGDADGTRESREAVQAPGRRGEFDESGQSPADSPTDGSPDGTRHEGTTREGSTGDAHGTGETTGTAEGDESADRTMTDRVRPDGKVTLLVGNDSATVNPPERVLFGVEVGRDSSLMGGGTGETVEFRIHWDSRDVPEDDELRIQ